MNHKRVSDPSQAKKMSRREFAAGIGAAVTVSAASVPVGAAVLEEDTVSVGSSLGLYSRLLEGLPFSLVRKEWRAYLRKWGNYSEEFNLLAADAKKLGSALQRPRRALGPDGQVLAQVTQALGEQVCAAAEAVPTAAGFGIDAATILIQQLQATAERILPKGRIELQPDETEILEAILQRIRLLLELKDGREGVEEAQKAYGKVLDTAEGEVDAIRKLLEDSATAVSRADYDAPDAPAARRLRDEARKNLTDAKKQLQLLIPRADTEGERAAILLVELLDIILPILDSGKLMSLEPVRSRTILTAFQAAPMQNVREFVRTTLVKAGFPAWGHPIITGTCLILILPILQAHRKDGDVKAVKAARAARIVGVLWLILPRSQKEPDYNTAALSLAAIDL